MQRGVVGAVELLEDQLVVGRVDAHAVVLDGDQDVIAAALCFGLLQGGAYLDVAAVRGELDGVDNDIAESLHQAL